jgi:tetratricopeptide (TPR) repeat protein
MMLLLLSLSCSQSIDEKPSEQVPATTTITENLDQGQQHPPIPADNPVWEWDAKGFVPDHGWFGEHNWTDVRMRVVGHIAIAYRDLARSYAEEKDFKKSAEIYETLAKTIQQIDTSKSTFAEEIKLILYRAAQRDANYLRAIDKMTMPTEKGNLSALRGRFFQLIQESPSNQVALEQLKLDIQQYTAIRNDLDITNFSNFTDRHRLRVELFKAYSDSVNPLSIDDPWGYWQPTDYQRQVKSLIFAIDEILQNSTSFTDALVLPSKYSLAELKKTTVNSTSVVEEFGRLPTGDSLIDIAGQPGPMGIGSLMKLDVSDPKHQEWLKKHSSAILNNIKDNPEEAIKLCEEAISILDSHPHGSRFYNVKQFRNACTRQLAISGHYTQAHRVFMQSFPLHHQDWACPNRKGLLLAISGRLLLKAGNIEAGRKELQQAIASGLSFLDKVQQAEQGKLNGPFPPTFGGGPSSHPHNPQPGKGQPGHSGSFQPKQHQNQHRSNDAHSKP